MASTLSKIWQFVRHPFGVARDEKAAEGALKDRLITGYRPALAGSLFWGENDTPALARVFADQPAMQAHPKVSLSLNYYKAGIAGAVFEAEDASDPQSARFILSEAERFWRNHREAAQCSYEFGRGGAELIYKDEDSFLRLAEFQPFAGTDCLPLVKGGHYAGIRVHSAEGGAGRCDLWGPRPSLPAKGWWHPHRRKYSRWYGWPQTYAAWRPWRRLAGRDGAEDIIDGGIYRFAFQPFIGRYPDEDRPGEGGVQLSSRDKMREMGANLKAGGFVGMPSRRDESGQYEWDLSPVEGALDVSGLIAYTDSLEKAISLGCGVPPELLEASEVGSGYSGRAIPLEAFYILQQSDGEALLQSWYRQVGQPLLDWNLGPGHWVRLKVKDLLKERLKAAKEAGGEKEGGQPQGQPQANGQGASRGLAGMLGGMGS